MLRLVIFFGFGAIWLRLFVLQVFSAQFYQDLAAGRYIIYRELTPERGAIIAHDFDDPTSYEVAANEPRAQVYADPRQIVDAEETGRRIVRALAWDGIEEYERQSLMTTLEAQGKRDDVAALRAMDDCFVDIEAIEPKILMPEEQEACALRQQAVEKIADLITRLAKHDDPYEPIARDVSREALDRLLALNIPGIAYVFKDARAYPEKGFGGHVLGFVGRNAQDDPVGQYGLEGYFEDFLAGKPGEITAGGNGASWLGMRDHAYTPAINGGSLVVTLDRTVQYTVCKILAEGVQQFSADSGVVVIVEPSTGRILAMCGAPDFDPAVYSQVENVAVYNNQAIFTPYEPGSIFKPITIAAGLDTNVITPASTFHDPGFVKADDRVMHNANDKVYGLVTMTEALEESINTAMVWTMRRTGKDVFASYVKNFGFGKLSGIEVNSESPGTISSLDEPGEVYAANASFGQGITTTPLQIVMAYAAIANGGVLMEPRIIDEMRYADGTVDKILPRKVRQVIHENTAVMLSGMLVSVVEHGHGKKAGVPGYWIAGKTGTAQIAEGGKYSETAFNGSFAGFGPVEAPRFAMVVKIENPKSDHILYAESTAAPIFGKIAKFLLEYYRVAPTRE